MSEQRVFVGRERQLSRLDRFLEGALAGKGGVCFITGEAGSGKTELFKEFFARSQTKHSDLVVAVGRCNSQTGEGEAYLPFKEILRLLTGDVERELSGQAISPENADRLKKLFSNTGEAVVWFGPNLVDIFVPGSQLMTKAGIYVAKKVGWAKRLEKLIEKRKGAEYRPPQLTQTSLYNEYAQVLFKLAEKTPLALVIDDLQWVDPSSLELLFHLGRKVAGNKILIVGVYRPSDIAMGRKGERHPLEPIVHELGRTWGEIQVNLDLSLEKKEEKAEAEDFVRDYVNERYSPNTFDEDFIKLLTRQTEGLALFIVELLMDLEERGLIRRDEEGTWHQAEEVHVQILPPKVDSIIEERIRRLNDKERGILTCAAVEGENFTAQVICKIENVSEGDLVNILEDDLGKRHRLVEEQGCEVTDGKEAYLYRFSHCTFQKRLYDDLGPIRKKILHKKISECLEELYKERLAEAAPRLVRHCEAVEDYEKALNYALMAARAQRRQLAYQTTIDWDEKALAFLDKLPDSEANRGQRVYVGLMLAVVYHELGHHREVLRILPPLEKLASEVGDLFSLGRINVILGRLLYYDLKWNEAREKLRNGLKISDELDDVENVIWAHWLLGELNWWVGNFDKAIKHFKDGIKIVDERREGEKWRASLHYSLLGLSYMQKGDLDEAEDNCRKALEYCETAGNPVLTSYTMGHYAGVYIHKGDVEKAKKLLERSLKIAQEVGDAGSTILHFFYLGYLYAVKGEYERSIEYCEEAIKLSSESGAYKALAVMAEAFKAYSHIHSGDLENAFQCLATSFELVPPSWKGVIYRFYGEAYSLKSPPEYDKAQSNFEKSIEICERLGMKLGLGRAYASYGKTLKQKGETEKAREYLSKAINLFKECGAKLDLEDAKAAAP